MKSIFGNNIIISLFGESHQKEMGITVHGLPSGIKIDYDLIDEELKRREPSKNYETKRIENKNYQFISGVYNDLTDGSPLTVIVQNDNVNSSDYKKGVIRPGQSDYPAYVLNKGLNDYRGGGHFSGRLTILLVIIGAIFKNILSNKGIKISSKVTRIGELDLTGNQYSQEDIDNYLNKIKEENDSVGGIIQGTVKNLPVGIGEPFFDSVESILAHLLFSIPSVKGVGFGLGVKLSESKGSLVKDEIQFNENKEIYFLNNYNGGINGGLTNGNDLVTNVYFKPISSIAKPQLTINLDTLENTQIEIKGRHDSCICYRSMVIVESMIAIGLLDLLCSYYSHDWMK